MQGAPEVILERCKYIIGMNGDVFQLGERSSADIRTNIVNAMGRQGLRTICLAYVDHVRKSKEPLYCQMNDNARPFKIFGDSEHLDFESDASYRDMTCVAIFGIEDPVRPGVCFEPIVNSVVSCCLSLRTIIW